MCAHTVLCLFAADVCSLLAVGACLLLVLTHTVQVLITCLFLKLLTRDVFADDAYLLTYSVLYLYLVAAGARLLLVYTIIENNNITY